MSVRDRVVPENGFPLSRLGAARTNTASDRPRHRRATDPDPTGSDGEALDRVDHGCGETARENTPTPATDGTDARSDTDLATSPRVGKSPLLSETPDRQILVVGGGVAGLALTAFLAGSGYDPVLLADSDRSDRSRVVCLGPLGRTLLHRIGVRIEALERENRIGAVSVQGVDASERESEPISRNHGPLVVAAPTLRDRLRGQVPDDAVRSYHVTDVTADRGGLAVRFDNGVREWFDLVVGADDPVSPVRQARDDPGGWSPLEQFEAVLEPSTSDEHWDRWTADGLAQTRPLPNGDRTLFRVTTASAPTVEDGAPAERFQEVTRNVDGSQFVRSRTVDPETIIRAPVTQAGSDGGDWGDGRVAYCGGAAFPVAPATGLRTTLALADAWVLADELVRGPASMADAVDSYGRRRRRRIEALLDDVDSPAGMDAHETPLPTLARLRALADRRYRGNERHQPTPEQL